jgi:ATP-binding cassette, subfamily B (MDR/TAP), member 1
VFVLAIAAGEPEPEEPKVLDKTMEWSLWFIYIGIAAFIAAVVQHACWRVAAHRQVSAMRKQYVDKLLRMDIAWFDQNSATAVVTRLNA